MLHEDESIGDCHIQQESEDIFVKFFALCPERISLELVPMIHSPHVLIVADDRLRTGDWYPSSILQLSEDTTHSSWLAIGRHDHDHLTVHPGTHQHFSFLDS